MKSGRFQLNVKINLHQWRSFGAIKKLSVFVLKSTNTQITRANTGGRWCLTCDQSVCIICVRTFHNELSVMPRLPNYMLYAALGLRHCIQIFSFH